MELRNSNSTLRRTTSNSGIKTSSKVVWTDPPSKQTVPVVYYLSRNGQLQHPHFIQVPLSSSSSSQGLFLRDVINRLISLRGNSMPSMYSWSSKRSYKNGYVWNDLGENDFIYPTHGNEYVLKGSELLEPSKLDESLDSTTKKPPPEISKSSENSNDLPPITRRRNQSSSSIDLQEYKVIYMTESSGELSSQAADASTQTDDKHRRHRATNEIEEETTTELTRDEISPPPLESSPEILETPAKCDGKMTSHPGEARDDLTVNNHSSGRMKASTVLMQLLTCGSISFKNGEDHPGLSLVSSQYKHGLPRGGGGGEEKSGEKKNKGVFGIGGRVKEDREYFSGSLVDETNKAQVSRLMRSSSHNADRRG